MLYISTKKDGEQKLYNFHVGESDIFLIDPHYVTDIQADGDELNHIYKRFQNIPISNRAVVEYFGDMAKFIIANW